MRISPILFVGLIFFIELSIHSLSLSSLLYVRLNIIAREVCWTHLTIFYTDKSTLVFLLARDFFVEKGCLLLREAPSLNKP